MWRNGKDLLSSLLREHLYAVPFQCIFPSLFSSAFFSLFILRYFEYYITCLLLGTLFISVPSGWVLDQSWIRSVTSFFHELFWPKKNKNKQQQKKCFKWSPKEWIYKAQKNTDTLTTINDRKKLVLRTPCTLLLRHTKKGRNWARNSLLLSSVLVKTPWRLRKKKTH